MKYYGQIGFFVGSMEVKPGVYKPGIIERPYAGDVDWFNQHFQTTENQNDDIKMNNQISIISDLYASENMASIRYITYKGVKWRVTNVNLKYPRLELTIGGVYNESGTKKTSS